MMVFMHPVHLRNIDLNLLAPLQALLEERNVTRAAKRINLSQSAMSRALERLRELLGDDLLVRTEGKYQLTPRGSALFEELASLVPRLEQFWASEAFSPATTQGRIRLAMTDYAATVLLPYLTAECERTAPGLTLEITPWCERSYEELSAATIDLVFSPLAVPGLFRVETLFEEEFVCLIGEQHPFKQKTLSLKRYLSSRHLSVETQPKQQNLIDRPLAESGLRRRITLHLPYLLPALRTLENTELILTTPSRLAKEAIGHYRIRQIKAPPEIPTFRYSIIWHPRLERDPLHFWFRNLVRTSAKANAR
jgi:DNA-binding transcriptional LysR family regulator